MKIKNSLSQTLTLCASASLRETNSYLHLATPKKVYFLQACYHHESK